MIKDKNIAEKLISVLDECSSQLNESIRLVQQNCTEDEFNAYREGVGYVMGYMYTDVLAALYKVHPDLEPDGLKS